MTFTDRRPYDTLAEEKDRRRQAARGGTGADRGGARLRADRAAPEAHHRARGARRSSTRRSSPPARSGTPRSGSARRTGTRRSPGGTSSCSTLLGRSLRGPLDELRRELAALAADDAGQLWPEANQVLHHLSAGYSRITTLIDNVLGYQLLDAGTEQHRPYEGHARRRRRRRCRRGGRADRARARAVRRARAAHRGRGRRRSASRPRSPISSRTSPGVDATGNAPVSAGGYMDNTVVVAAAQRGEVVRIEVRGPYAGGDPVHEPIVRGIVRAHGGVLQTHDVPGMSGSAYVLEVPIGGGAGAVAAPTVRPRLGCRRGRPVRAGLGWRAAAGPAGLRRRLPGRRSSGGAR